MSDEREPNNRSDAALRERMGIAEKAAQGPWKSDEVVTRKKDFEPSYVVKDKDGFTIVDVLPVSAYQANAAHIAASSPDVVRADIEELLLLRQENKRLCGEIERVHEEADWLAELLEIESPYCYECEFKDERDCEYEENITWCAHAPDGTNDTCDQSWRKAARKAVEEERHG